MANYSISETPISDGSDTFPVTFPTRVCVESLGRPVTPVTISHISRS